MSAGTIGIIGLGGLFALLAIRMPVAIVLILVGLFGIAALNGWPAAYATLAGETFVIASFYELSVIPLFVLMGNFATASGMSRDLYAAAYAWIGHWRGGLASATIVGCSGFAALSGSSVASAVTMGRVALALEKYVAPSEPAFWALISKTRWPSNDALQWCEDLVRARPPVRDHSGLLCQGIVLTSDPTTAREMVTLLAIGDAMNSVSSWVGS